KDHSGRMMDTMSDIVWAINPANDNFEKVKLRMKEFAAEILEPAGINYFFEEDKSEEGIVLNIEKRKDLYMLFKEAITNAAKYSEATEVNIIIKIVNKKLLFTVVDNGIGFDTEALQQGNGLRNMRTRAEQMKADFHINSIPGRS